MKILRYFTNYKSVYDPEFIDELRNPLKFEMYFSMLREYDPEHELKKHITHIANIVGTAIVKSMGGKIEGDKMLIDEGVQHTKDKAIGFMAVPGVGTVQLLSNL